MSTVATPIPTASPTLNGSLPRRKVLVLFPAGVDPEPLADVLTQQGLEPLYLDESPVAGSDDDVLAERLSSASALLAVIVGQPSISQVYAIGYARAVGKRVTILADDPNRTLRNEFPSNVSFIWGTLADAELLQLVVRDTQYPTAWPPQKTLRSRGPVLPAITADAYLARAANPADARTVLGTVVEILATFKIEAAVNESAHHLALWVEGLDPWINNPTLIRAAGDVQSVKELESLVVDFGQTLRNRGCNWGLLVTGQLPIHAEESPAVRNSIVLVISLADLLARLKDCSLADVLLELRRQRVRGRS